MWSRRREIPGPGLELNLRRELRMEDVWFAYRTPEREPRFVCAGSTWRSKRAG